MDTLETLVLSLSVEEARYYKLLAFRTNKKESRKDVMLFDRIRQQGSLKNAKELKKASLFGLNPNAMYRLRNRVNTDLQRSLVFLHYNLNSYIQLLHFLTLSKIFLAQNKFELCSYALNKAERIARENDDFILLDSIYNEMIHLSIQVPGIDPEDLIQKIRENIPRITQERKVRQMLALINSRLRQANFSGKDKEIMQRLNKIQRDLEISQETYSSPIIRLRIAATVVNLLLERKSFSQLEQYLLDAFHIFQKENIFNRDNHSRKLLMITQIVTALYKNYKFQGSLNYASLLHEEMKNYNKLHYNEYLFFYYNSLAENYHLLNRNKEAIQFLEEYKSIEHKGQHGFYLIFILTNLAVLYFSEKDYRKAAQNLSRVWILDAYPRTAPSLRLSINILDLVIHFELEDLDYIDYKYRQMRKEFREEMKDRSYCREQVFLEILLQLAEGEIPRKNMDLKSKIENFLSLKSELEPGPNEAIYYNIWLESRRSGKNYYELLLSSIQQAKSGIT